jgi:ATP-dependent Clp protease ATP-binding subunit ClpB
MRYDKLTIKGQEALVEAERLSGEQSNPQIEPEHLLKILLVQDEGIIPPILSKLGVAQGTLFGEVEKGFGQTAQSPRRGRSSHLPQFEQSS